MIQNLIKTALGHGRLRSQPLMEKMYSFSLHGMNFGMAQCATSGETNAMNYAKSHLSSTARPLTLFDVGANVGEYTTSLQQCFGMDAVIHSFEPALATFRSLSENVASFPKVQCHNFGFSDQPARVELHYDGLNSAIASVYPQRPDHDWHTDLRETIALRTIDDFCSGAGIRHIDFLKIDIEGHEFSALVGARRMMEADAVHMIQFEFGPRHVDSRTYFRDFYYLLNPKYRISRVVADGFAAIPAYSEYLELFGAPINYFAEHR